MNNEQVMRLMADIGLHEGGMDNWVLDNAWVKFANLVAAQEREACAKVCDDRASYRSSYKDKVLYTGYDCAAAIRARGTT